MPQVSTHLLGSTDGYTTLAHSPDLSAPEIRELEDLMHGQAEEPAIRANLDKRPTALLRRLQSSGRYAISRILAGQQDSTGRETIAVCTIVLDPKAFSQAAAGDMWGLLKAPQLWKIQNFSSSRNFSIPDIAPVTRAVTQNDALLFDTWVQSRNTANGLGVIDNAEVFEQALVNLGQVLHPEDRLAYMWGCHLLSPQSPAQLASFANPNVVHRGRRSVVQPSATPQTSQGQTALQSVGKTQLPSSRATPIPAKSSTSAWGDGQGDIGLEETLTPRATRGMRWSQPNSTTQPRPALPMTWLAVGAAALIVLAGSVLFGIWKYKRDQPPMPDTQVTATKDNPDTVEITWVAGERAATHTVERSEASASPLSWESLSEQASPFRDKTGKPGIKYVYRVQPASLYGVQGEASNSAEGFRPPAIPGAITVSGAGKQAKIKWDPVQGASKYEVVLMILGRDELRRDISNNWYEFELLPGETLGRATVVAVSEDAVRSRNASWNLGFTQTKTEAPDPVSKDSISIVCPDKETSDVASLQLTWTEPSNCKDCTYEITYVTKPATEPPTQPIPAQTTECTIRLLGTETDVDIMITAKAVDTLGNQVSSLQTKYEWHVIKLPLDFAQKEDSSLKEGQAEVTWTVDHSDPSIQYKVEKAGDTSATIDNRSGAATIKVSDTKVSEVQVVLVCTKPNACTRKTAPITVQIKRSITPPAPPAEPTFPQAMKDSAERYLKIVATGKASDSATIDLSQRIRKSVGLEGNKEFSALIPSEKNRIKANLQIWISCLCSIARESIAGLKTDPQKEEPQKTDAKDLASELMALQKTHSRLPELLRTKDEEPPQEGVKDDISELVDACPDIKSTLEMGEAKMMQWLEAQDTTVYPGRSQLWIAGLRKLKELPDAFCKDLLDPEKLKEPDSKAKKDADFPYRLSQWKQVQYPTWVDLTIYACLYEPPLSPPNRLKLRNALAEVLKDSQRKGGNIAKETLPFIDYALMRVKDTNP